MITHYGLFRSERDVFWGRPKNRESYLAARKNLLEDGEPRPRVNARMQKITATLWGFIAFMVTAFCSMSEKPD